ncbi:hypothetical protein GCM10009560_62650 [Nonomuraea longicatena]|uniref:ATP-grasp-modified RiPP n=1 Tax=Nonomuraea longicatena TaxID=83682 RepID=A0ABN1QS43_9ACTN
MIDNTPLTRPDDRFPIGLPGHTVPLSMEAPTAVRPWGMDHAVPVAPLPATAGKHERPTKTTTQSRPTKYNVDGRVEPDTTTVTVTD